MNSNTPSRFPTLRRFLAWISSSRIRRPLLFAIVCLVTVVALFYAEENWRGKRAWNQFRGAAIAAGEPFLFDSVVPPPIPDTENFVDTAFMRLVFERNRGALTNRWPPLLDRASSQLRRAEPAASRATTDFVAWNEALSDPARGHRSIESRKRSPQEQSAAARAVLERLKVFDPVLDEFRANLSRPRARYPIVYLTEEPYAILLPHLKAVKDVVTELDLRACAELASGNSGPAFEDVMLMVRLAQSLKEERFIISQLVRYAILHLAAHPVWEGLVTHRWTADQAARLQEMFESIDVVADLPTVLRAERAAGIRSIDTLRRRNGSTYLSYFLSNDATSPIEGRFGQLLVRLVPSGWFYFEQANYARLFEPVLSACEVAPFDPAGVRRVSAEQSASLSAGNALRHHRVGAVLLFPALEKVAIKVAAAQTVVAEAGTACAIERYRLARGEIPSALEALTPSYLKSLPFDYFARRSMAYRTNGPASYLLYSVGPDVKDNGGKTGRALFDEGAGDWVWSCPQPASPE